jgi:YVTN family beta-propeller protein
LLGSNELPIGSELLGYRIEGVLGRGGMGIVYLAQDLRLKRPVALKLLSPELAADERFRLRLRAESELAASLDHPNIVPIYEVLEADFGVGISMRFVEGKDLKATLRNGPLPAEHALSIVSQVASALDAAHGRGLVHRDVKPSNVLIAPQAGHEGADHAYLADFGLSKRLLEGPDGASPSRSDHLTGTVEYVAPEQIRGEDVDGRADVYSLGCLLFECLAGKPPYADASDTAVLFAHLQSEPPTLPGLEQVLPKALAKSPEDRYQTCRELVEGARRALGLVDSKRSHRRQRVALLGVVLATVAALAGVLLVRSGSTPALAAPGRLVRIDPKTNSVVATASMGQDPSGIAVGAGRVWMTSLPDAVLLRIDPKTFETKRISLGVTPLGVAVKSGVAFGKPIAAAARGGLAFVAGGGGVTMVDPSSGQQTGKIPTGDTTVIAGGSEAVWAVTGTGTVDRLVDTSYGVGKVERKVALTPAVPVDEAHAHDDVAGIAVGERSVWVLGDAVDRHLWRIDPVAGRVIAVIPLPFAPGGVAAGLGGVWVTAQLDDRVLRVDPETNRIVATIPVGRAPWGVAVGSGAVWVANTVGGTVSRVDPGTNRVVATISVDASPNQIAVGEGSVWVAAHAH